MVQEAGLNYLSDWRNFYMLIGTAAATLTGLMFVATTLLAGLNRHISTMNLGISTFYTPTVVQFCTVLVIGGYLNMPWQTLLSVRILLGLLGLGGMIYMMVVAYQMKNIPHRPTPLNDRLWYMGFPLIAYIVLILVAFILPINPGLLLYFVSLATFTLLLIGIRNTWDLVTFIVIERSRPGNK